MRRLLGFCALLAVAGVFALHPGDALGHAALVRSDPAPNAFLQKAPTQITLTFTEPLDQRSSSIRVLDSRGGALASGKIDLSDNALTMTLKLPKLNPGIYNVVWSNVSRIDGHALRGSYPFTVLNPDGSVPTGTNTFGGVGGGNDPAPVGEQVAVRALSLLGLVIVAGAALVVMLWGKAGEPARPALERTVYVGAAVLGVATLLNLAAIKDVYSGVPLKDVVFQSTVGGYWLTRFGVVLLLGVGGTFIAEFPKRTGAIMLAFSGLYIWAYTQTSHAAAGSGSFWARSLDLVHGLTALLWVGAIIGVLVCARLLWRRGSYGALMARFTVLASVLVYVLIATGIFSSFIEIDTPSKLVDTRYGVTLLVKIGLILPMLLLGFYNMRTGRKRLASLAPGEPRRFIYTAGTEAFLGLAVLVAAAFLTQTTVSKSVATDTGGKPFDQTATMADLDVQLHIDPNKTGINTYQVKLFDKGTADPVDAERVRLTFRYLDDQNVGPSTLTLDKSSPGTYTGEGPFLTLEGQWRVEAEVRRANVDDVTAFFNVRPAGAAFVNVTRGGQWANPVPSMNWNEVGGLLLLVVGFGLAIFRGQVGQIDRRMGWAANGASMLGFALGVLLLFGVHSHSTSTPLPANPIYPDVNSVATGRYLYANNCASCHGQNGVPPKGLDLNPYPLDLTVHTPQHPDGQLFNFIAHGVPGSAMIGWLDEGKLTTDEVWHLVNFLRATMRTESQ